MQQSEAVMERMEEGGANALAKSLLDVLEIRFGAPSPELTAAIHGTTASSELRDRIKLAVRVASLEEFRQATGL